MIKRISAVLLLVSMLLLSASCKSKVYKPVESTEEESKTVFKLGEHEVPYELFRTFFLTNKEQIDGGNSSVWLGNDAPEYRQKAIDIILPQICEIYAMFSLCNSYGIDIYSEEIEKEISDMVTLSVDGGSIDGNIVAGHKSYDDYLAYLKSLYMNDSVSRFLMRYSICEEKITEKNASDSKHTSEDVYKFFESDECAHISWLHRSYYYSDYFTPDADYELAEKAHSAMKNAESYDDIIKVLVQYSSGTDASTIANGFYIGKYTLDSKYMQEIIDAAFTLKAGEHSDIIENYYGVYIVYAMEKDSDYLKDDSNYERIAELYVSNEFYKSLEECKNALLKNVSYTDFFNSLNFAEIEY
ncbi:MAG: hypothetical protein E7587_02840 [Ruminococcaceae bacterium]|nr:hypothetical protein [Oscillospiraceae bacterium]